ncbi:hypothetical protein UlMin_044805 [Ulmus minor]
MATSIAKSCLQSFLKIVNSTLGLVGIAMILYGLWLIRVWERDMKDSPFHDFTSSPPWLMYAFLGAGAALCVIMCVGHLAASVANGCCLSFYMMIIFLLLLLETGIAADILLNRDWEEDLPYDPTGRFNHFKDFVKSNLETFKWIGFLIILTQGLSILAAMVLRSLGPNKDDSDDEYSQARLPLIKNGVQPPPYVGTNK